MKKWTIGAGSIVILLATVIVWAGHEVDIKIPECESLHIQYQNSPDGCKVVGYMPGGPNNGPDPLWILAPFRQDVLDVGDIVTEVGGRDATGDGKNLQDLVELAYTEKSNGTIKVKDGTTGSIDTFKLPLMP